MADGPLRFVGFAGSLRRGSYNRMLLHALLRCAHGGTEVQELDVTHVPLYNEDLDTDDPPKAVCQLREAIGAADGLIVVTPEHNYTLSGVTKTVIEWASRPPENSVLDGKPVAVLGGAPGGFGTVRAQLTFRQMAPESGMLVMQDPEVRVSRIHTKFDADGKLLDENLRQELREFLDAFALWCRRLSPRTARS